MLEKDEVRFLYDGAKISQHLLDNAIIQLFMEATENVADIHVKRATNRYLMHYSGGNFNGLIDVLEIGVFEEYAMDIIDHISMQLLVNKIHAVAKIYDGLLVMVPEDAVGGFF